MAVYGGLRSPRWLRAFRQAPMVTAFRNLESGQVLFSQTLHPQQFYIDQQFKWPNWQNKKPTTRKDLWRPLAVAEVPTWEGAVQLYRNLVELRHRRDMHERKQARDWRRKSAEGNIWYWNQYRPTYTYEAVADLVSALEAMGAPTSATRGAPSDDATNAASTSAADAASGTASGAASETPSGTASDAAASTSTVIHWDKPYRKGDDVHWAGIKVEHRVLPAHNPREQFVVLNNVRREALERAEEFYTEALRIADEEAEALRARGEPTADEARAERRKRAAEHRQKVHEARLRAKERLLAARPELAELAARGEAVRTAARAWRDAVRAFDPYTPRGQRGAAKQPIKLRQRALRQAKRSFRDLKRRIRARSKKRRVPQPRIRMQL